MTFVRFTLHFDDSGDPRPGWRWWRYLFLGVVAVVLIALVIVAAVVVRAV